MFNLGDPGSDTFLCPVHVEIIGSPNKAGGGQPAGGWRAVCLQISSTVFVF